MLSASDQLIRLGQWGAFLNRQIVYFEECITRELGHPFVADEVSAAFLETDEGLVEDTIETAVDTFIRDDAWPHLTWRERLHLEFRARNARWIVFGITQDLQGEQAHWPVYSEGSLNAGAAKTMRSFLDSGGSGRLKRVLSVIDLNDRARSIRWFFIDQWKSNSSGRKFLATTSSNFLKMRSQ